MFEVIGQNYGGFTVGQRVLGKGFGHDSDIAIIGKLDPGDDTARVTYENLADTDVNFDWIRLHLLTPVDTKKAEIALQTTSGESSYKLHLQSSTAIDWKLITSEMCAKHPVQLVTTKDSKDKELRYVAYHHSIITKAFACRKRLTAHKTILGFVRTEHGIVFNIPVKTNSYTVWVKQAHKIIAMPWPKELRDHSEITVVTPF